MAKWWKKRINKNVEENKPIKITDLQQYRMELEKGTTEFDFSELSLKYEDIQNINLENLNLDIDLRQVFVPYNGCYKIGNNILKPLFNFYHGEYFLKICNSRLAGNNVVGDLSLFAGNVYKKSCIYLV